MKPGSLALLVVLGWGVACQAEHAPGAADIVIASDLPTSGQDAEFGVPLKQAIQLAIARNPKIGRFNLAYEPLDDSLGAITARVKGVQNVRRMVADPRVLGMVGPATSTSAFDEIPVANAASLAMVSPSNTNWCLTLANPLCNPQPADLRVTGPNNYFRVVSPDPVEGRAMARFAAKTLNVRRAAAYTLQGNFDDVTLKGFADEFKLDGGDLVLAENLPDNTTDFRPFLEAARSRGAEAIYGATEADVCQVRAQMKGIFSAAVPFLSMDNIKESTDCIDSAADNGDGMFATISVLDLAKSDDQSVQKIVSAYRQSYPHSPGIDTYGFNAYDCALILIGAITQAVKQNGGGFPTRQQVVSAMAHSQFQGLTQQYSFDANGDVVSPPMALYQVEGGQWVYLRQIDASPSPT